MRSDDKDKNDTPEHGNGCRMKVKVKKGDASVDEDEKISPVKGDDDVTSGEQLEYDLANLLLSG